MPCPEPYSRLFLMIWRIHIVFDNSRGPFLWTDSDVIQSVCRANIRQSSVVCLPARRYTGVKSLCRNFVFLGSTLPCFLQDIHLAGYADPYLRLGVGTRRREFIAGIGAAAALPRAARAQQHTIAAVGFLYSGVPELTHVGHWPDWAVSSSAYGCSHPRHIQP